MRAVAAAPTDADTCARQFEVHQLCSGEARRGAARRVWRGVCVWRGVACVACVAWLGWRVRGQCAMGTRDRLGPGSRHARFACARVRHRMHACISREEVLGFVKSVKVVFATQGSVESTCA